MSDDKKDVTVQAEVLGAWRSRQGTVVRARFRQTTDAQVHDLIRVMFSDPNAWARDRYVLDRPFDALLDVFTSPIRAGAYAMDWMNSDASG